MATAQSAGSAETKFRVTDLNGGALDSGDPVNLQCSSGQYVVAELGGAEGSVVNCNRASAAEWETFVIEKVNGSGTIYPGDSFALKSYYNFYVVAEGGGGGAVNCDRYSAGAWETFVYVGN